LFQEKEKMIYFLQNERYLFAKILHQNAPLTIKGKKFLGGSWPESLEFDLHTNLNQAGYNCLTVSPFA
jgi:hypothetical protein